MKYKLRENEEAESPEGGEETSGGGNREKIDYELVLTSGEASVEELEGALKDINNYGIYISNLRNTKADLQKSIGIHFGTIDNDGKLIAPSTKR